MCKEHGSFTDRLPVEKTLDNTVFQIERQFCADRTAEAAFLQHIQKVLQEQKPAPPEAGWIIRSHSVV